MAAATALLRNVPVVNTECGPVVGKSINNALSFVGIPYASPPIGKLRWQPPKKISHTHGTCWNGTFFANVPGSPCYQYDTDTTFLGSEDCLYLNVYTPTLHSNANLPVMVWVHGGSYASGWGHDSSYAPEEKMAADTNVVYVTHNYRLHTFGFMALQILADASPTNTSGNYGIMDTLVVLEWVRDNIRNFGGDPSQVTLYGHSAGATHVLALMTSPLSKGLFQKAWMASGSPRYDKQAKDAYNDNLVYLKNTNCSTLDCLLALTSQQATEAVPWDNFPNWDMYDQYDLPYKLTQFDGSMAIIDGYVVPKAPFEAFTSGFKMDIPFLVGSTGQEMDGADPPSGTKNWTQWTKTDFENFVHAHLDTFSKFVSDMAIKLYPVTSENTPRYQWASMVSDIRVNCGNNLLALIAAKTLTSPVYRYVDTNQPSQPWGDGGGSIYPFHTHDIYAFIGSSGQYVSPLTDSDIRFERNIRNEIISFVRHGRPNSTSWTKYPDSTALISENVTTVKDYHASECEFLFANGFFPYSWRQ